MVSLDYHRGGLVIPNVFQWFLYGGQGPTIHPVINSFFPTAFAIGILLAGMESLKLTRRGWAKLGNIGFLLMLIALFLGGWFALLPQSTMRTEIVRWTVKIASGLMVCYIADPQYLVSRWLCAAPLRWFGLIRYELYLLHQPIALWARSLFGPCDDAAGKYIILVGGSFAASVASAALFYKLFSLPILKSGCKKHAHPNQNSAGAPDLEKGYAPLSP